MIGKPKARSVKHIGLVAIGLVPIMNPLSTAPLFLSLTNRGSPQHKRQQALRASLYAFIALAAFLFLGNDIIALFGIFIAWHPRGRRTEIILATAVIQRLLSELCS